MIDEQATRDYNLVAFVMGKCYNMEVISMDGKYNILREFDVNFYAFRRIYDERIEEER